MSKIGLRYKRKAFKRTKLKEYQVKITLSYNGIVTVRADSKKHAVDIVETDIVKPEIIKCSTEMGSLSQDAYGIAMEDNGYLDEVELKIDEKKKHIR